MGQYYKPVSIDKMEYLYSHNFGSGLKLMEHSYIGNDFVRVVERLLSPKGAWYKTRFCWSGDYMDEGLFVPTGYKFYIEEEKKYKHTLYSYVGEEGKNSIEGVDKIDDTVSYDERYKIHKEMAKKFIKTLPKAGKFLVNHTRKVCLDLSKEEKHTYDKNWKVAIHPLPLLTCSGNGRGGGDYRGNQIELLGTWAGDVISMEHKPMYRILKPCNFIEA